MIASKEQLEKTALNFGMLPFFANRVPGFSVEEMAAPGVLFGDDRDDYGCWDWKGPVIRDMNLAYGKFFRRKAGFVSLDLLPDFINYRRSAYPLEEHSTDSMILDIIKEHEALTSTELKKIVFGTPSSRRAAGDLAEILEPEKPRRHSLEGPLQRLQMGAHLVIADFEYKYTATGDRYGFGVALYTTPEALYGKSVSRVGRTPAQSFAHIIACLSAKLPLIPKSLLAYILK